VRKTLPSLSELSDQILAEVSADARTKEAAAAEKTAAVQPACNTELGALLYKLAAELRACPKDVTYQDLAEFIKGDGR
jgi:hypothetical protein